MVIDQLKVYSREHRFVADVTVATHFNIFVRLSIFTLLILTGCNEETQNANTLFLNVFNQGRFKYNTIASSSLGIDCTPCPPVQPSLNHYHMVTNRLTVNLFSVMLRWWSTLVRPHCMVAVCQL